MFQEIYKAFLENIPWPTWISSVDAKILFINKPYEKIYNMKLEEVQGKHFKEIVPEKIAERYYNELMQCIESKEICKNEALVNGKYLECTLFPILNEKEKIDAVAGMIFDVTEQRRREKELKNGKDILRTIIDSLPEAIFYKDRESRFLGYNKAFERYYNQRGIYDIKGRTDLEIYGDQEVAKQFITLDKEVMEYKESKRYEQKIIDDNGIMRIEENIKVPVLGEDGEAWGVVGLSRDITDKKALDEKLKYISEIDALTGLYNRYSFEEKINLYTREEYLPLGMIMGDVNGLKLVNDTLGHLEGDELLKSIAEVLKKVCKAKGHVFRWGGDEFFILIPNCTESMCEEMMTEIRESCENYEKQFIQLSIALGEDVKYNLDGNIYDDIRCIEEKVYRQKLLDKKSMKSSVLHTMKKTLEEKNMETREHADRVANNAVSIGRAMGFKMSELDELELTAELHDIGKITIAEELLLKPSKLTEEEFEILKTHAEKGYRIIHACGELIDVAKSVLTHHERWDGSGYPLGLKEDEIPLMARIISIADAYDVMTHDRVYKSAISQEEAFEELRRNAGTQFDPQIVEVFIAYLVQ